MPDLRVSPDDPKDMAFVLACLRFGVITLAEFKTWVVWAITMVQSVPAYFYALMQRWDDPDFDAASVARIVPSDLGDTKTIQALVALGHARRLKGQKIADQMVRMSYQDAPLLAPRLIRLFPMLEFKELFRPQVGAETPTAMPASYPSCGTNQA